MIKFIKKLIPISLKVAVMRTKERLQYRLEIENNRLVKNQLADPQSIPIIIINFNQLFYLKQLVDFFLERNHRNIVIVDNASTYLPLLNYYEQIRDKVTLELMPENYGHMVFFEQKDLHEKYNRGYYFLTDADIVPNEKLPEDFALKMISLMQQYCTKVTKIGFALNINDIPDHYKLKSTVVEWEREYWKCELKKGLYKAIIDTTFALYKPGYPEINNQISFYNGIRIAGNYTAKHGGWYTNVDKMTDEELYYKQTASQSNSWKLDDNGNLIGDHAQHYSSEE